MLAGGVAGQYQRIKDTYTEVSFKDGMGVKTCIGKRVWSGFTALTPEHTLAPRNGRKNSTFRN